MEKGLNSDDVLADKKDNDGNDDVNAFVESTSGAAKGSSRAPAVSREQTGNGHTSQNGDEFDRVHAKSEGNQNRPPHVEEQELLDGWAKLSPSSETLSTFVQTLGVEGVRVDQWFNVDVPETTAGCVYGLVFLYKWRVDRGTGQKRGAPYGESFSNSESSGGDVDDVMFVNQFVNSGSASQGVLTALLNLPEDRSLPSNVTRGPKLTELSSFCRPLTPAVRAAAVCSSASVHEAHNHAAICHPSPSVRRGSVDMSASEDFWMYTVYTPGKSRRWVYELDGRAKDRKLLGSSEISHEYTDSVNDWVGVVTEPLEKRVNELRQHRVPFQLYALVENVPCRSLLSRSNEEDEQTPTKKTSAPASSTRNDTNVDGDVVAIAHGVDGDAGVTRTDGSTVTGKDGSTVKERAHTSSKRPESSLSQEEYLVASHDYEMFFIEMLKLLGSKGELIQLVADAARGPVMTKVQDTEEEAFSNGVEETSIYDASIGAKMNDSKDVSNHTATSSDD